MQSVMNNMLYMQSSPSQPALRKGNRIGGDMRESRGDRGGVEREDARGARLSLIALFISHCLRIIDPFVFIISPCENY